MLYGLLILGVGGMSLYEKHYDKTLVVGQPYREHSIQNVFECEALCLEHGMICVAANVYYRGPRSYECQLFKAIPVNYQDFLRFNASSKFIVKRDQTNDCISNPCQNNGTCIDIGMRFRCDCIYPYVGVICDKDMTKECSSNPCYNGGTCIDLGLSYQCSCPYPYSGINCEIDTTDECSPNPCYNGGTCTDLGLDFMCICPAPYNGTLCQYDPCGSLLCDNGGSCLSGSCQCTKYCFGIQCEECIIGTQRPVTVAMEFPGAHCQVLTESGWILLMRRMDGSVDFYRKWADYRLGFGNLDTEFWIGNECIHLITNNGSSFKVRFDFVNLSGDHLWAEYSQFNVGPESDKYRLSIAGYNGIAGDSMLYTDVAGAYLDGKKFTTPDNDNDNWYLNCATDCNGPWWHDRCSLAMLTGLYGVGYDGDGVKWKPFEVDLPFADMKITAV